MDFTREPIIETIITPKEGHKLTLRNTKVAGAEEYSVDAVEVVTFGGMPFYRSLERPKAFLVPISDFEVLEVRELKVPLKNASFDRTIKIASKKESKETKPKSKEPSAASEETSDGEEPKKKRTRRRGRKSKTAEEAQVEPAEEAEAPKDTKESKKAKKAEPKEEAKSESEPSTDTEQEKAKAPKKRLVPPPTTLISETISRYKSILLNEEKTDAKKPPALPKELLEEEASVATEDSEKE